MFGKTFLSTNWVLEFREKWYCYDVPFIEVGCKKSRFMEEKSEFICIFSAWDTSKGRYQPITGAGQPKPRMEVLAEERNLCVVDLADAKTCSYPSSDALIQKAYFALLLRTE